MTCEHRGPFISLAMDARIILVRYLGPSAISVQAVIRDLFPHTFKLSNVPRNPLLVQLRASHRHCDLDVYPGPTLSDSSVKHADSEGNHGSGMSTACKILRSGRLTIDTPFFLWCTNSLPLSLSRLEPPILLLKDSKSGTAVPCGWTLLSSSHQACWI